MANLKACPLCGSKAKITGEGEHDFVCSNKNCIASYPSSPAEPIGEPFTDEKIDKIRKVNGWGKYAKRD